MSPAADRCAGCAEAFCGVCLVEVSGQKYCGGCKVLVVQGKNFTLPEAMRPCPEAKEALICAVLGIIPCLGLVLSIMALRKAGKAKQAMADDPQLTGSGKANAAIVTAVIFLAITVFGMILRASRNVR